MEQKKNFTYLTHEELMTTIKALTELHQRAQEKMKQTTEFSDEWAHRQGEVATSRNALGAFQALEVNQLGAWTLTFEPGKEGQDRAHQKLTGQPLYGHRMPDVPMDELR